MEINLIKKALEECIMAIEAIHPTLDENEPCIAYTAHVLAKKALDSINRQPEDSADNKDAMQNYIPGWKRHDSTDDTKDHSR